MRLSSSLSADLSKLILLGIAPVLACTGPETGRVTASCTAAPCTEPPAEVPAEAEELLLDLRGGQTASTDPPLPWLEALDAMLVVESRTEFESPDMSVGRGSDTPSVTA